MMFRSRRGVEVVTTLPSGVVLSLCPLGQVRSDIARDAKGAVAAERIRETHRKSGTDTFCL